MSKECRDCKELLSIDKFYSDKRNKDGKTSYCGKCMMKRVKESKSWNRLYYREYIRAYMREYRKR